MDMAQKVLSSDFNQLIKAMKDAQKNANTFLEAAYQKEMLQAAHVVAKNSKLLLTLGAHAQRGLRYFGLCVSVCVCVCVCVCVSTLISALRATKRMMSDTNGFCVTSARKIKWRFS